MIDKMCYRNEANASGFEKEGGGQEGQKRKAKNGIVYIREILSELQ